MLLSMQTSALRDRFGDAEAVRILKKAGFDGIDYSMYWDKNGTLEDDYKEKALNLRRVLDENDMKCVQAHAPFNEITYGENLDMSNPLYEKTVRSIEFAAILGAKAIVVHRIRTPKDVDSVEYNYKFYKGLEKYCEKFNIKIAVENLFCFSQKYKTCLEEEGRKTVFGRPEYLSAFIKRLNSPWFTACIDLGHASVGGIEPEDYILGIDKSLITLLHVHDNNYLEDSHCLPYNGNFNWENIIDALVRADYTGDLSLELSGFEKYDDEFLPEALKYTAAVGRHLIEKFNQRRQKNEVL